MDFEKIKTKLESKFPEYKYSIGNRKLAGDCIIVKNTKYSGVDIFIKKDKILIEAAIPEMKTRLMIGTGVLFLKLFSKKFKEPSNRIHNYLKEEGMNVGYRI